MKKVLFFIALIFCVLAPVDTMAIPGSPPGSGTGDTITVSGTSDTLNEYIEFVTMNCVMVAIVFTDEGGLNIQYGAGKVWVDDVIQDTDARGTDLALTDDAVNYIYATKSGGATLQVATSAPGGVHALVATIQTAGGDIEYWVEEPICDSQVETTHDSLDAILGEGVISGVDVAVDADGTNANDFTISTGVFYLHAHVQTTVSSVIYSAGVGHAANDTTRFYHSSGSWTSEASDGVDFGFWDNGTDKTAVNVARWYAAPVFIKNDEDPIYVYPQTEHLTEDAALEEAITYPPFYQGMVVPLAVFVFRGSQSDFTVPSRSYFEDVRPILLGRGGRTASQFVYATFTGDSGSTTADAILDSFSFTGGTGITTAVSGKVVTITATGGGSGDVVGPGSSTDNTLARYHLTTGKIIQTTSVVVDDSDNISGIGTMSAGAAGFTVDADGDTVVKSVTVSKVDGVAGEVQVYEANSTDTSVNGFRGAASLADNQIFQFPDADPTAGQIWTIGAPSSTISQITYAGFDGTSIENSAGTIQIVAGGVGATEIASTAVTPGSYTFTALTVDADGRITAASSGSPGAETNSLETTITGIADTEIFIGNGADSGTFAVMSGDATMANTGAITIGDDKIDSQHYIAASIDNEHLADDAVNSAEIADGAVDAVHLAADAKFQSYAVAGLSDTTTPSVLTTAETTNKCISNYKASGADHVFKMPAAHAAGNVIFPIGDEFQVDIEPDTGDLFYLNGIAMAANEHIQNTADTLGERIVGYCVNINGTLRWMFYSSDTTWVEETPP